MIADFFSCDELLRHDSFVHKAF